MAQNPHPFRNPTRDRIVAAGICLILAILALVYPVYPGTNIEENLGFLLVWLGVLEIYDGFRRPESRSMNAARFSGALSLLMGVLLINAILFQSRALHTFIVVLFLVDMLRYVVGAFRDFRKGESFWFDLAAAASNLLVAVFLAFYDADGQGWVLAVAVCLRILGVGISMFTARKGVLAEVHTDVLSSLGLAENPHVRDFAEKIKTEEDNSTPYDRSWIFTFVVLLFVIHLGRMGLDRSYLGILSPLVATLGDMVVALIITYAIIAPLRLLLLKLFRRAGRNVWSWAATPDEKGHKKFSLKSLAELWLDRRIRSEIRFRKARYSFVTAIRTGLKVGLPVSALIAAIMPMLGMSWYFDTENWASGVWDKWAAARADHWRMAMTSEFGKGFTADAFRLQPSGLNDQEDFSFVIVGDPGEGDASQLVLKDKIIEVTNHPDVRFLVISSDVVYPNGTLRDYERKFWMPFKGVTKPVYAIPGNHDWYDALDGFVATFYEPEAARKALLARVAYDLNLSATSGKLIDDMIEKSARWRKEYEVPTGFQQAPYFQIRTGNFVFISVETGVVRQIDSLQRKWLVNVLEASKGKFVMVLLGHPFYAAGEYQGNLNPDFESIHRLLRQYHVPIAMGGDTHDLEYYVEPPEGDGNPGMRHFVNGGGGAYLSIGAAMAKPGTLPTKDYAFYPSHDPLVKKITENTAWYKKPAWWWAQQLNGWPFSAEWLSAGFDYNVSPFFQSFVEVKVQASQKRIVIIPYSNHGRIKWSEMTSTEGARPKGAGMEDYVEWVVPFDSY